MGCKGCTSQDTERTGQAPGLQAESQVTFELSWGSRAARAGGTPRLDQPPTPAHTTIRSLFGRGVEAPQWCGSLHSN